MVCLCEYGIPPDDAAAAGDGCPPGPHHRLRKHKEGFMFDAMSNLWSLMTVFFTVDVIYEPLFMGLLLMPTIFYVVYLLIELLDYNSWTRRF